MIFSCSNPPQQKHYSEYRDYLRVDFRNRCAYCLVHEANKGGDANFEIDHYHPRHGKYGRLDLENVYFNLYWVCHVCNSRKGDRWVSPEEEARGWRWIDPCETWGDHELHWHIFPDGEIERLTPIGEYTVRMLMFDTDQWLKYHWRKLYEWQEQKQRLEQLLSQKLFSSERDEIENVLQNLQDLLTPPVFNRPQRQR